jgi:mitochondrial intermembrane space import and assembly protein 40
MQDCFRQHPDIYGSELDEDEVDAQLEDHIASTSRDSSESATATPSESVSTVAATKASLRPAEKQILGTNVGPNAN